jgi:Tfp pilus assembly protein PilX
MTTTIGSLTNVPVPGDPIRSNWPQSMTPLGVHPFASKAALDAAWATAPNGAFAVTLDDYSWWQRRAGTWQRPTQQSRTSQVFDSGGVTTVTHSLGRVPTTIIAMAGQAGNVVLSQTGTAAATTFQLRGIQGNTNASFVGTIFVNWWIA